MSVDDFDEAYWVAGTDRSTPDHISGRCADCGVEVYYSATCKPARTRAICMACCDTRFGADAGTPAVTEATLEELGEQFGIDADAAFELAQAIALRHYGKPLRRIRT